MQDYNSPEITEQRDLSAQTVGKSNGGDGSDAEIKHGIEPVERYEAPEITAERDLSGATAFDSLSLPD